MRRLRGIGFTLAIVALTVGMIAGVVTAVQHIPKPEKRIEWLQQEDSVIVQMRDAGGDTMVWSTDRDRMPSFTLYGDGTLIVSESTENCGTVPNDPCSARLLESHLSDDSIEELLDFVDGTGFFAFQYEQPVPPVSGAPTMYIYVNTKLAANAVRADALGWEPPDDTQWTEFRKLGAIRDRIVELQESALTKSTPFETEEGMLEVVPLVATDLAGVPEWPYPAIALPPTAADEVAEVSLSAEQIASLGLEHANETTCWDEVQYASRLYVVCYRPALPFEENFPEFDDSG